MGGMKKAWIVVLLVLCIAGFGFAKSESGKTATVTVATQTPTPNDPKISNYNRGEYYFNAGDFEKAAEYFEKAGTYKDAASRASISRIKASSLSPSFSIPTLAPLPTPSFNLDVILRDTEQENQNKGSQPAYQYDTGTAKQYKDGLESDGKIHVYLVGSGETVQAKKSSSIRSMTYYADSDHLIINFNGKEYAFANVSSSLWKSFKEASSSDAFYESHFKGNKSYWINDYNGKNGGLIVMEKVNVATRSSSSSESSYSQSSSSYSSSNYYDEYAECVSCGEIYSIDEMWDMGGEYICENCADSGDYIVDEYSGELYHIDDYYDMMHEREFGY